MDIPSFPDTGWEQLLSWLPSDLDLETGARRFGALRRRRRITAGSDLLRLALAYGPCGMSLRETAAWAGMNGLGTLSDVAVLKRLRGAADWLEQVVGGLLSDFQVAGFPEGRRLRLVDGTCVSGPGSRGTDWRIHACYDPGAGRFSHLEITDGRGAESLTRGPVQPGDIHIADRGYAKAKGLQRILAEGGEFLVRTGWCTLKFHQPDGSAFDLFEVLPDAGQETPPDLDVLIQDGARTCSVPARLIVLRKPPAAEAQEKKRLRRNASRKGTRLHPSSLKAAGHVMLVTSLSREEFDTETITALYRLRWQIELAFKRLKSILRIKHLPARDPGLARTWLYAHLIAALLIERMTQDLLDSSPSDTENTATLPVARP